MLEERENGTFFDVVKAQIEEGLFNLSAEEFGKIILAYEPVWAIGTGKTATDDQAQEMHAFIRKTIADKYGCEVADNTSILYGGSCKPSNAKELFAKPDVDGGRTSAIHHRNLLISPHRQIKILPPAPTLCAYSP